MRRRRGKGRIERVLFSFMGPPQLGSPGPSSAPATPSAPVTCATCGQPYDAHEVVRGPRLTHSRCPSA